LNKTFKKNQHFGEKILKIRKLASLIKTRFLWRNRASVFPNIKKVGRKWMSGEGEMVILKVYFMCKDFPNNPSKHLCHAWTHVKLCSRPRRQPMAIYTHGKVIKTIQLHFCFSEKNERGYGINLIWNKISNI